MKKEFLCLGIALLGFSCNSQFDQLKVSKDQMTNDSPLFDPEGGNYTNPFKETKPKPRTPKTTDIAVASRLSSLEDKTNFLDTYFRIYKESCEHFYAICCYDTHIERNYCDAAIDDLIEKGILSPNFKNEFIQEMNYWSRQIMKTPKSKRHHIAMAAPAYLFEVFANEANRVFENRYVWESAISKKINHDFIISFDFKDHHGENTSCGFRPKVQARISGPTAGIAFSSDGLNIKINVKEW